MCSSKWSGVPIYGTAGQEFGLHRILCTPLSQECLQSSLAQCLIPALGGSNRGGDRWLPLDARNPGGPLFAGETLRLRTVVSHTHELSPPSHSLQINAGLTGDSGHSFEIGLCPCFSLSGRLPPHPGTLQASQCSVIFPPCPPGLQKQILSLSA